MEERAAETLQGPRTAAVLGTVMAALGALLSLLGVYALVSWAVSRRTREIGVRMALGAGSGSVRRTLLRRALGPALLGVPVGLLGAVVATGALRSWLHGVSSLDPFSYLVAGGVLLLLVFAAAWLPSARVTRVDPMRALRLDG
jgi:ABC-type antimicrobial peptide transport system permease subunit